MLAFFTYLGSSWKVAATLEDVMISLSWVEKAAVMTRRCPVPFRSQARSGSKQRPAPRSDEARLRCRARPRSNISRDDHDDHDDHDDRDDRDDRDDHDDHDDHDKNPSLASDQEI